MNQRSQIAATGMLTGGGQPVHSIRNWGVLLIIAILLLLFWGIGFAVHVAGGLIHILLVIALVVFVLHFVGGGTRV